MCQPGNFIADSECKKCEVNTYGSGLSSICTACSEGLVSDAGSSSADDCKLGKGLFDDNVYAVRDFASTKLEMLATVLADVFEFFLVIFLLVVFSFLFYCQ